MEEQERNRQLLEKDIEDSHNAIHQYSAALGKPVPEMGAFADMSLKQMARMYQTQLGKLQQEKDSVMKEMTQEWTKLHSLWAELETPRNPMDLAEYSAELNEFDPNREFASIDESRLGVSTVKRMKLQVQHWTVERDVRARTIAELSSLVGQLETQLGEEQIGGSAPAGVVGACSFRRINLLKARLESLCRLRDERAAVITQHRGEIVLLYSLLQTPQAERIHIADGDLSRKALDTCEREKARLLLLKQAKMRDLVEAALGELRDLYAELGLGEGRIKEICFPGRPYTEATFTDVQNEVKDMKQVIDSCRSITALIPKREQLRALHHEVEARQQDPSRLLSKKGGKSLIEEQKMEAKVKRDLPPLEKQILQLIEQWEATYKRNFLFNGQRYADVIIRDQQEDMRSIEERKQRIAERKMRDLDASNMSVAHTVAPVNRSVVPATARPAQKTQTRIAPVVAATQSARPATKTISRTSSDAVNDNLTTPTNIASKRPAVSVSRSAAPTPKVVVDSTTPIGASKTSSKYAKVKSKVDTHRSETQQQQQQQPLQPIHNTPKKKKEVHL